MNTYEELIVINALDQAIQEEGNEYPDLERIEILKEFIFHLTNKTGEIKL